MIDPGTLAVLDQERMELERHLDALIATYVGMAGKSGVTQAEANLVAFVPTQYTEGASAGLLMTAIARLINGGAR